MAGIASVWTLYGLDGDPYFQDPLSADVAPASPRSTGRFVGREPEIAVVCENVVGADADGNSRSIVEGAPGIGKTSFVNRVKDVLAGAKRPIVLTHAQPIRIVEGMGPRAFAADLLRTLLLIREGTPAVGEPASADGFWRRIRRIVHGEDTIHVGVSVAGLGGSAGVGRIPPEATDGALYDEVARALVLLAGKRQRRVLLHVNNLENLTASATADVSRLLQNVRDYFLLPHSHWIFVGATGIDAVAFRATPQVSGIMPPPIALEPLSDEDVLSALRLRYTALRRGRRLIEPITAEAVRVLYQRYRGDLRNFLRVLSNGVKAAAVAPATSLTVSDIVRGVAYEYQRTLATRIGIEEMRRLHRMFDSGEVGVSIRATEVAQRLKLSLPTATRLLASFESVGVIRRSHVDGRSVYYAMTGDTSVALGVT